MSEKIDFSRLNNAEAFHLIERHARDWAHAGELMDEFAQAKNSQKWISVSERRPEHRQRVIFVAGDNGGRFKDFLGLSLGGEYCSGSGLFFMPGLGLIATHWQPMPEPPK